MPISSQELAKKLTEALGLPPRCRRIAIILEVDAPVRVEIEFYPDGESIETVLKEYRLTEKE